MFGWSATHIPFLVLLPLLLVGSAFFSGSETALFGLSHGERMALRSKRTLASRAIDALMADQRMLLITVLLGNMVVNVLYFVISSVLMIGATSAGVTGRIVIALGTLVLIVLFGEVIPKLIANSGRMRISLLIAPPMLAVHRAIMPLRRVLDAIIIGPLSRLTAPGESPSGIDHMELASLLQLSGEEGVIDESEQRMLEDIINLRRRRVSHVMTPRTRVAAVTLDTTRAEVTALAREIRFTKLPVIEDDLDHVIGVLHVKRFLLDDRAQTVRDSPAISPPRYIPEVATLDHLLDDFRHTRTQLAMVVDEYGGTAGIVAIEDIVHEIVGELRDARAAVTLTIERLAEGCYRASGDSDLRDLARTIFGDDGDVEPGTIGGLIVEQLGRAPEPGDRVRFGRLMCEVETMVGVRVADVLVTLAEEDGESTSDDASAAEGGGS